MSAGLVLALETSCDETAAAVISPDGEILADVVASQAELHARFGGVVPEIASRRHLELVTPVLREALDQAETTLDDVGTIAVTQGPGLVRRAARRHLGGEGDRVGAAAAARPRRPPPGTRRLAVSPPDPVEPPFLCLLASGGHTLLLDVREHGTGEVLGTTLDDAAGEAFDKGARLLGLGYPGGRRSTGSRPRVTRPRTTSPSRACRGSTSPSPG